MANHHPSEAPFRWRAITLQRRHSDGALSPRLFERVAQAGGDETIPVLVWLDDGGDVPPAPRVALGRGQDAASPAQIQAARDRHRERMAEVMERQQAPVIADVAARRGRVVFASRLAPILSAELTPQAIRALEKRPDVRGLDLDVPVTPLIEEGTEAIRAHEVWSDGLEGDSGTTVAVVESGMVYPSSAYLTVDAVYDTSPCNYAECASQHDHATGVAAVIAWNSNPAADYSTDPLDADLDLYVLDPGGALLLGDDETSESLYG